MTLLAVAISFGLRARHGRLPGINPGAAGGRSPASVLGSAVRPAAQPGVDWIAAGIVVTIVVAGAVLLWLALRPRRRDASRPIARLQEVLDEAVDDALHESDPRRAVIEAWTRLERVLARHGLPRRAAEAPFEYAARAGSELGVEPAWLERLAGLFEWARFSLHDVTPAMREEAVGGLVAVRDGLRAAS
jgi:hypothetical protein